MTQITIDDLRGTPRGARPRSRVLEHFNTIREARGRGWSWSEIGEAIGLGGDATRKAHHRVRRAIDAGRIDAEALKKAAPPSAKSQRPQPQRPTRPQAETHNAESLRAMGVQMIGEDS